MHNNLPGEGVDDRLSPAFFPLDQRLFLEGPAGAGKTSLGVARLAFLLEQGVRGDSILVLVPQRTLAEPYAVYLRSPHAAAGGMVSILTAGGLAQRMVDLFWPLLAEPAGFSRPDAPPVFLTLESAQYFMARLVRPLFDQGIFNSVNLDRNRLYSQILDNLNKAALVGFSHTEIGERLKSAWIGDPGQLRVYEDVQTCANLFRTYCLENNLLDFSLQVELFWKRLRNLPLCREYLQNSYRHLIFDNIEEDTPFTHDLVREWLPVLSSALLIFDQQAGYRSFLGADPVNAYSLKERCDLTLDLQTSYVCSPQIQRLSGSLAQAFDGEKRRAISDETEEQGLSGFGIHDFQIHRYFPEMLDWATQRIASLVHEEGVAPGEIAVLAPFLSDALRFSLLNRLEAQNVPVRSHRPSRSLREEPVTHCLLTLSSLAFPAWNAPPDRYDLAYALVQAIDGLDLVRAQLLADQVLVSRDGRLTLLPFDQVKGEAQERITYRLGERYEQLRLWLEASRVEDPDLTAAVTDEFDPFLSRLFGEVLSQPGFGFHQGYAAGEVTANLIESVQKFRWAAGQALARDATPVGQEYLAMLRDGVIAAQYMRSWKTQEQDAVLLAPAYTFLLSNRPVEVQFWLDVGSRSWSERLNQPLTHPYVLSRQWKAGKIWSDLDEVEAGRSGLSRLVLGLLRRCRSRIYLGLSEFGEQGYEQRGPLLHALQRVFREVAVSSAAAPSGLRPAQEKILAYRGGKMGISAVPGSGKTWTLSRLAARIIAGGELDDDQEVLVVTLVNSSVDNFYQRVSKFITSQGLLPNLGYRVRTLHSLAYEIVQDRPGLVGLAENFTIIDERDLGEIFELAVTAWLNSHPYDLDEYLDPALDDRGRDIARTNPDRFPKVIQSVAANIIQQAKDLRLSPERLRAQLDALPVPLPLAEMGAAIYSDYQRSLAYRGAVDFTDLIRLALQVLESEPDYLARKRHHWPYILEDEAQDSSQLQEQILSLLAGPDGNWVRVGDPNQAIYETFTTANPKFLRQFIQRPDVSAQSLPNSGRSSLSIINLANHLVEWTMNDHPLEAARDALQAPPFIEPTPPGDPQPNPSDDPRQVLLIERKFTPDDEIEAVADSVQRWLAEHPDETVAVLAPRSERAEKLADELRRRKTPLVESLLRNTMGTRATSGSLKFLCWVTWPILPRLTSYQRPIASGAG